MKYQFGARFGKLTIINLEESLRYTQENGRTQTIKRFLCQCDCGQTTVVRQASLLKIKSCGCERVNANVQRTANLLGKTFHYLTVTQQEHGYSLCQCSCGNPTLVKVKNAHLKNGNTKSCGCYQRKRASESASSKFKLWRKERGLPEDAGQKTRPWQGTLRKRVLARDLGVCVWCDLAEAINVHHLKPWATNPDDYHKPENLVALCTTCHLVVHNHNFHEEVNPYMTTLLQGYALEAIAVAKEVT